MTWFKVDDRLAFHPKVLAAGDAAVGGWVRLCAHASGMERDGFLTTPEILCVISRRTLSKLLQVRLLDEAEGGYQIHDYLEYNPSAASLRHEREKTAARVAEWRSRNGVTNGVGNSSGNGVGNTAPVPTRPVPTRKENKDTEGATPLPASAGVSVPKVERFAAEVREVYEHWLAERLLTDPKARSPKLDRKRADAVRRQLASGTTIADLKRAVTGCLRSKFHVDGGHTDLTLICRDDSHVERFIHHLAKMEAIDREEANVTRKRDEGGQAFDWRKAAGQ